MTGTGRQYQPVVAIAAAILQQHFPRAGIDAAHRAQHHPGIALRAQDTADRPRDIGRIEVGGSDLLPQRLKKMKVALVDDSDLHRRILRRAYR